MLDATPSAKDRVKVTPAATNETTGVDGELGGEDEEDEEDDEDEEEEEEKYDIDDSSPEAIAAAQQQAQQQQQQQQQQQPPPVVNEPPSSSSDDMNRPTSYAAVHRAAMALGAGGSISSEGHGSGIETPGRFAGEVPHPPKLHARHLLAEQGTRQSHAHAHHHHHGETPLTATSDNMPTPRPQDQEHPLLEVGASGSASGSGSASASASKHRTPTGGVFGHAKRIVSDALGHRRGRSTGDVGTGRRTFAVYGQDESDSNASD
ncbi:hypothetical protein FRB90_009806 [Tulasnella sp. 427]|nr:hypothetical protein FRB90_009806 [Tulasnella sp. 427]